MNQLLLNILFWGIFVGGGTIFVIFCFVKAYLECRQHKVKGKDTDSTKDQGSVEPEYTMVTTKATVIDQACFVKTIGIKTPKTVKEFVVVFQTESDDILKLSVPEELYEGFELGQTGILTMVDGDLYGFLLEEEDGKLPA